MPKKQELDSLVWAQDHDRSQLKPKPFLIACSFQIPKRLALLSWNMSKSTEERFLLNHLNWLRKTNKHVYLLNS